MVNLINQLESLATWRSTAVVMASDDSGGWHDQVMPLIIHHPSTPNRAKENYLEHGVTGSEVDYRCMENNWRTELRVFRIADAILIPGYFDQVDITEGPVQEPNRLSIAEAFVENLLVS